MHHHAFECKVNAGRSESHVNMAYQRLRAWLIGSTRVKSRVHVSAGLRGHERDKLKSRMGGSAGLRGHERGKLKAVRRWAGAITQGACAMPRAHRRCARDTIFDVCLQRHNIVDLQCIDTQYT